MSSGLFSDLPTQVSLERQIACVDRELGFRRRVYARRVLQQLMTQAKADEELVCMEAVRATLARAQANRAALDFVESIAGQTAFPVDNDAAAAIELESLSERARDILRRFG